MSKKLNFTIFFVTVLTAFLSCSAQQKEISAKEFEEIQSKATEKLTDKTYRLTKTEEYFPDRNGGASPERVNTRITEIVQPDKKREVEELKSSKENTRTERIWDGKNLYVKENNRDWKKYNGGGNSGGGDFTSGKITTTYKFIEKSTVNNQAAYVYEVETHRKATKYSQTDRFEVEYIEKTKYWIGENGLYLKSIKENEIVGSKSLRRDTWVYEYDTNIKIETPIIEAANKPSN